MARKKRDEEKSGKILDKIVDELDDSIGPATRNNRVKRFIGKMKNR